MRLNSESYDGTTFPSKNFRRLINGVSIATPPSLAGFFQFYIETHGSKMGPFNFIEEFSEGSLPALMGGLAMLGLYTYLTRKEYLDNDIDTIGKCLAYGSGTLIGYIAMMVTGSLIHQALGVPDVKWGPFN